MKVYHTVLAAMTALANKRRGKDGALWTIKCNDNGWYYLDKKRKRNPMINAVEIYSNIQSIDAVKGHNSLWPREQFRHKFKPGAKIYGLPNGDILIHSTKGRRLWKKFKYPD